MDRWFLLELHHHYKINLIYFEEKERFHEAVCNTQFCADIKTEYIRRRRADSQEALLFRMEDI